MTGKVRKYILRTNLSGGLWLYWNQPTLGWTHSKEHATIMIKPRNRKGIGAISKNCMAQIAEWIELDEGEDSE